MPLALSIGVLHPRGPVGAGERLILFDSLAVMLLIAVPVIVATLYFAWKYRASNSKARYQPDWVYSGRLEFIIWAIPTLAILFLGGIAWVGSHELDPAKPLGEQAGARYAPAPAADAEAPLASAAAPFEVEVVSLDWKWLFIYPHERIATLNQLTIPAGVPVHFRLTSASVLNAFFVPQLGSQIYTMAGMVTQLHLQADEPGTFAGLSSHFSGDGFSDMHFNVDALSPAQFAAWVEKARTEVPRLDAAAYAKLAKPSQKERPRVYGTAEPELFDRIVASFMAGGKDAVGARAAAGAHDVAHAPASAQSGR